MYFYYSFINVYIQTIFYINIKKIKYQKKKKKIYPKKIKKKKKKKKLYKK